MTIKTLSIGLIVAGAMAAGQPSVHAAPPVDHGTRLTAIAASKPGITGLPAHTSSDWHGSPVLPRPPFQRGPGYWPERQVKNRRYHRKYRRILHGHIVPPYTVPGYGWQIPKPRPK